MASVLLSTYFPRSLRLEGGTALIDSIARELAGEESKVTVHAPLEAEGDTPYELMNYHESHTISYLSYLRQLKKLSYLYESILLLDNSPATSLYGGRVLRHHPRVIHHFGSPYQPLREIIQPPYSWQYLKHWLAKGALPARIGVPKNRVCVVSTEYQREQLSRLGVPEGNIQVIPWGIVPARSRKIPRDEARQIHGLPAELTLGYLGHFSPVKGVPVLVAAFKQLLERFPEARLALAWSGKGAESAKVHRMIQDPTVRDRISLLGVVDPGHFLSALDVCVLPYVHTSIPHPPLVMLEAFAVGTPVITTDVGGLGEVVIHSKTGLLIPPNRRAELREAIATLLSDESLRQTVSENQLLAFQNRYHAGVVARKLRELI
jgi:glycosyltransferase involved in cell wall biosynthesis